MKKILLLAAICLSINSLANQQAQQNQTRQNNNQQAQQNQAQKNNTQTVEGVKFTTTASLPIEVKIAKVAGDDDNSYKLAYDVSGIIRLKVMGSYSNTPSLTYFNSNGLEVFYYNISLDLANAYIENLKWVSEKCPAILTIKSDHKVDVELTCDKYSQSEEVDSIEAQEQQYAE